MAQIAYKVTSIDNLPKAFTLIAKQSPYITKFTPSSIHTGRVLFGFSFVQEPSTYFEVIEQNLNLHNTNTVRKILWVRVWNRIESPGSIYYVPCLPYSIDYECISGESKASSTYIGNKSGTFKLLNVIYVNDNDNFYFFFGEDYFSIVDYKNGNVLSYLICSCRSEQNGAGGYVLSSDSALVGEVNDIGFEPKDIYQNIYGSSSLLCYYNKFGDYRPNHAVDSIDSTYCSVPYNSLTGYSQQVPQGRDYITVKYAFDKKWYARCTCSLLFDSTDTNKLPVYNNLVNYIDSEGSPVMSNTLNGISLLLPNYFFIDASPLSTHEYKYVFDTPEMCYCSMYNMLSGRIVEQNYPTKGNKFMCFSLSSSNEKVRKNNYYKGLAFMLPIRYDGMIMDEETASIIKE